MKVSKIDGTQYKNNLGLSIHLKKHGMTVLDYMVHYENFIIPKCPHCGKNSKMKNNTSFRKTCGSDECKIKEKKSQKWNEESKEKQRKNRFKFLREQNNRKKTSWYARATGKLSYGENFIHEIFTLNKIYEKYDVINEYPIYPYFIDFAFINEKVAVEFDGACHFNNGNKRIQHDIIRDEKLRSLGWRIYRVAYFELNDFRINDLIFFIGNPMEKQLKSQLEKYSSHIKKASIESRREINNLKYTEQQLKLAENVIESHIEFEKYGWVQNVSEIIGKKPQKVSAWMKRFLPEIYEKRCFKRVKSIVLAPGTTRRKD